MEEQKSEMPQASNEKPRKKMGKGKIVAIVVVVILVFAAIVFFR